MDYAGLDFGKLRYPVNRPIGARELDERLIPSLPAGVEPNNYMSVIRVNSKYLELVDRWYPVKGFNVWLGAMGGIVAIPIISYLLWGFAFGGIPLREDDRWVLWLLLIVAAPISLFIFAGVIWLVRSECFRWTHYPMKFDRANRIVHVFRQNGSVLEASWDDLFFHVGESTTPPIGRTFDLRAHVLADDGITVLESFSFGYVYMGGRREVMQLWEFVRRYMEDKPGPEMACLGTPICLPVHDRREGFVFGVVRTFSVCARWPFLHPVLCIPLSLIAVGRWVAMTTSRVPIWPSCTEEDGPNPDDSISRDWRNNERLGFWDELWPLMWTVVGTVAAIYILFMIDQAFR